jgi:hypothetical protein
MGGCPWVAPAGTSPGTLIDEGFPDGLTNISYAQDASVSQQVWQHCQTFMQTHGFLNP